MEGVILFADNSIFEPGSFENDLFKSLNESAPHPVLPINSLQSIKLTTNSISTFRAIILDWNFHKEDTELDGAKLPESNPMSFLEEEELFSLIFVYSRTEISTTIQSSLKAKYGNKIEFLVKSQDNDAASERDKLLSKLKEFEAQNEHLQIPFLWSNKINKSVQSIFKELELADKYWVKDLYFSSYSFDRKGNPQEPPPVDAKIQVINLLQTLISERLVQDAELRKAIQDYSFSNLKNDSDENSLKLLFQRLYYTKALDTDSIMTGDIYELDEACIGIVISPECDMNTLILKKRSIELLCFDKGNFANNFDSLLQISRTDIEKTQRAYNQEHPRFHLLPVLPIHTGEVVTALIDFRFAVNQIPATELLQRLASRYYKLNSPYIQQLRQRYIAYLGRVGVPSIPGSIRSVN